MADALHLLQPSFARGEVSPYLFGRVDLQGWSQGLRTLRNFVVRPEGSVSNRQGFGYVGNALLNTAKASILIPFIFSASQSYAIEVGNLSAQVFSAGGIVVSASPVAISAAAIVSLGGGFGVQFTTAAPHGLVVGQNIAIASVVGTGSFAVNGARVVATVADTTHFTVAAPFGNTGAYTSGGTVMAAASFATPWAAADLSLLRWSQSADTLTLVHPNYPPYEIKRTSANTFTCLAAVYTNGPFLTQNTDGTTFVYASAASGTVDIFSTTAIFNANQVGGLFKITEQDLSAVVPWETIKNVTPIPGAFRRSNGKNYVAASPVIAGGTTETGSVAPSHSQGVQADGDGIGIAGLAGSQAGINWVYHDSGFGIVLITQFVSSTHVKGVVQPNYPGGSSLLPISVVGGPQVVWTAGISGDGVTKAFTIVSATSTDPNKYLVFINGVYQPPGLYSVSGTTITFIAAPPTGVNNVVVQQITSLGQTTYWAFGAFSVDQGYPSAVSYFPDRLILAATPKQPVGVFGSKTAQYHDFGVSTPIVASDAFSVFLNARQLNAINDLIPLSDLLVGTSNIIWRLWPGQTGVALSPLAISANPQSFYGESQSCASVLFGDSAIFAEYDGRRLRDLIYQFAYDKFVGQELTLYSRHLIPYGTTFQRLAYKPDAQGQLVFGLRSDGVLLICTYLREQQVLGWARWDTQGSFEDICVVPENSSFAVYAIVNRNIGGANVRYVERLSNREVTSLFDYRFLDCGIGYDGRNASSTTMSLTGGSTYLAGDTATLSASSSAGWANFLSTDITSGNELWLFQSFRFAMSVAGQSGGTLQNSVTPGSYVLTFTDGETRYVTVASDGITCTWDGGALASGTITSATCRVRCLLTGYVSATQATVRLRDPCPAGLQGAATSVWTFARTTFGGAVQIAGKAVVGYVDGNVIGISDVGSVPNGSLTVASDGSIVLPSAGGVVQLGLPYLCDFESLPLNEQGQETIRMRSKAIPVIYLDVTEARNFLAGTDFTNLSPHAERAFEPYVCSTSLQDGIQWARVNSELTSECHTCVRQNMPLPITIRAHIPQVMVGEPIS